MLAYLLGLFAFFQVQSFDINYYSTSDGLSNNIVYDIHQDQQGFIWVATENGLNRFDAYEFKKYYHSPTDSLSISSNVVRSIFESEDGNLWFGTRQGINLLDKKTGQFTRFLTPDSLNISTSDVHILRQDSKGKLWYIAQSRLINFDPHKRVYGEVKLPFLLYNFVIDENDIMWISGYDGFMYSYSLKTGILNQIAKTEEDFSYSFFLANDGKSVLFNSNDKKIIINDWESLPLLKDGIRVERFLQDSNGRRWFGTEQGLFLQESSKTKPQELMLNKASDFALSNIKDIIEDKAGGIWIASVNGLYHLDPRKKKFEQLDVNLPNKMVMAIEETDGSWWVNHFYQQLTQYRFEPSDNPFVSKSIALPTGVNQIWDIEEVGKDKIWLATEHGLHELTTSTFAVSKIELPNKDRKSEVLFGITKASDNSYWLSGYGALFHINSKTGEVYQKVEILGKYDGALVQDILVLDEGLLIATETHGLFYYSKNSGLSKTWNGFKIADQLDQTSIWDIYESNNGAIWIGGNNGLFQLNKPKDIAVPLKMEIGDNRIVFSITEDKNGVIWLGTDRGLIQFDQAINEIRLYSVGEGISNPEFNRRSIFTSSDGRIVAGGMEGAVYFNPDEISINQNKPEVWITDFRVVTSDSIRIKPTHNVDKLILDWQSNSFEIDFTALNYTDASQNQYQYQLVGHDPDWVIPKESRQARYVRVPAGEYTFKVIASNNDGVWNEAGDSITITVQPPFWQTYWFRVLVLGMIGAIVWALYRFRVKQLLEVERVRLRIAGDLHDEIGSGLSGIALTGDLLQNQAQKGNTKPEMIEKITTNARSLASSLDSIVWLIDPNKETVLDLIIKCKRTANELLANHHLIIKDEVPESFHNKELPSAMRRNYYLIFKETAHNILKHAHAKKVDILLSVENGELIFSITDDGHGFDEQKVEKGKGLEGIKERAKEINAHLSLDSQEGKGTTVSIQKALP